MPYNYQTKRGDTAAPVRSTLSDEAGVVDLSNTTSIRLLMQRRDGLVLAFDGQVDGTPTDGKVVYEWQSGDTSNPGIYDYEWEVVWSDGTVATFPEDGYLVMKIDADLG